jgi:hypothetical protein
MSGVNIIMVEIISTRFYTVFNTKNRQRKTELFL